MRRTKSGASSVGKGSGAGDGVARLELIEHPLGVSPTIQFTSNHVEIIGHRRVISIENRGYGGSSLGPLGPSPVCQSVPALLVAGGDGLFKLHPSGENRLQEPFRKRSILRRARAAMHGQEKLRPGDVVQENARGLVDQSQFPRLFRRRDRIRCSIGMKSSRASDGTPTNVGGIDLESCFDAEDVKGAVSHQAPTVRSTSSKLVSPEITRFNADFLNGEKSSSVTASRRLDVVGE